MAAHGYPRATKDLDVWLMIDPDNANRVVRALDDFEMSSLGLTPHDFPEPQIIVQLGYPPTRIDLRTSISGVDSRLDRRPAKCSELRASGKTALAFSRGRATISIRHVGSAQPLGWSAVRSASMVRC